MGYARMREAEMVHRVLNRGAVGRIADEVGAIEIQRSRVMVRE